MPKKRSKPGPYGTPDESPAFNEAKPLEPQPGETRVEFGVFGPRQFESAEAFSAGPEDFGGEAKSAAQFGERLRSMVNTQERRDFVDRAAIAIYANGWPAKNVYARAMLLWELRQGEIERGRL